MLVVVVVPVVVQDSTQAISGPLSAVVGAPANQKIHWELGLPSDFAPLISPISFQFVRDSDG